MMGEIGLGIRSHGPYLVSVFGQHLALGPPSNVVHNAADDARNIIPCFSSHVDAAPVFHPKLHHWNSKCQENHSEIAQSR